MSLFIDFPDLRELNITTVTDTNEVPIGQTWLVKNIVINKSATVGLSVGGVYHELTSHGRSLAQISAAYTIDTNITYNMSSTGPNIENGFYDPDTDGGSEIIGNDFGGSWVMQTGDHISSDPVKSGNLIDFTVFYYILEQDLGIYLDGWPTIRRELFEYTLDNPVLSPYAINKTFTVPTGETWFVTSIVAGFDLGHGGFDEEINSVEGTLTIKQSGGTSRDYLNLKLRSFQSIDTALKREALPSTMVLNEGTEINWAGSMTMNNDLVVDLVTSLKISYYVYELDFPQT